MAVRYNNATAEARHRATIAQIDAGSGPGRLIIGTAGMAQILASIEFADPCGVAVGRSLVFDTTPHLTSFALTSGIAAEARIEDSNGEVVISGMTAGVAGTDIVLTTTAITEGQAVPITSGTITTP